MSRKSAKGVTKHAQNDVTHDKFKDVLLKRNVVRTANTRIASANHSLHTLVVNKLSLSAFDDKRFLFANGIESLPYGHHHILETVFHCKILNEPDWGDQDSNAENVFDRSLSDELGSSATKSTGPSAVDFTPP